MEDLSLVTILGVDKGEHKRLRLTADIALPVKLQKGGMSEPGETPSTFIVSAEGNTLLDGLSQMTTLTSRTASTTHTQIVIFGEELAREDAGVILDVFSRNLEFRHNTFISVCKGSALEFINQFSWPEEIKPSDYLIKLLMSCHRELGICPLVSIHDFLTAYSNDEVQPWAPYISLASPAGPQVEQKGNQPGGPERKESKPQVHQKVVALLGSAVFRKTGSKVKMIGVLDTLETMAVNMLKGDFSQGFIDIAMPGNPETISTLAFHHFYVSCKVEPHIPQTTVRFTVRATASMEETTARQFELSAKYHQDIVETTEQELTALLSKVFSKLQDLDTDVIGLGMNAHKHFKTWPEWEEYGWPSKFKAANAEYDTKIFVFTSGFTDNPPIPR